MVLGATVSHNVHALVVDTTCLKKWIKMEDWTWFSNCSISEILLS